MTDRGVSVTLNYVLSLAITTLLVSGLLLATGNVVDDRRESVIRSELQVVGEQVAASLMTADRLALTTSGTVVVEASAPAEVGGEGYQIQLNGSSQEVVLETTEPAVTVTVPFENETDVSTSRANGGDVEIVLTGSGELEVRSA